MTRAGPRASTAAARSSCSPTRTAGAGTRGGSPAAGGALERALALRGGGPYVVQAAIAALHADDEPDWPQIAALYGELARLIDSPVVEQSRAVAIAEAHDAYAVALGLVHDEAERRLLTRQQAALRRAAS